MEPGDAEPRGTAHERWSAHYDRLGGVQGRVSVPDNDEEIGSARRQVSPRLREPAVQVSWKFGGRVRRIRRREWG